MEFGRTNGIPYIPGRRRGRRKPPIAWRIVLDEDAALQLERDCINGPRGHVHVVNAPTSQAEPPEAHHEGCCGGHRPKAKTAAPGRSSFLGVVLPVLACAVCPTCLGAWAQALSAVGVGFVMTETEHLVLLITAVVITLAVSGRRYARSRRAGPLLLSLAGAAGLVASHALGEIQVLAWSSIGVLVAASIWQERARPRKAAQGHEPELRGALRGAEVPAGVD